MAAYLLPRLELLPPLLEMVVVLLIQRLEPLSLVLNQQVALLILRAHTHTHTNIDAIRVECIFFTIPLNLWSYILLYIYSTPLGIGDRQT